MSLYNLLHGEAPSEVTETIIKWFGWNPQSFPRYRECWIDEKEPVVVVHTRTGGDNREEYDEANDELTTLEGYDHDDDDYDSTYANWYYKISEEFHEEWKKFVENQKIHRRLSKLKQIESLYPIIDIDDLLNKIVREGEERKKKLSSLSQRRAKRLYDHVKKNIIQLPSSQNPCLVLNKTNDINHICEIAESIGDIEINIKTKTITLTFGKQSERVISDIIDLHKIDRSSISVNVSFH